MRYFSLIVGLLLLSPVAEKAPAQVTVKPEIAVPTPVPWERNLDPDYGDGDYYAAGYSPWEGEQRGRADVIRSGGEAAESLSRARINNEIARSKFLDNRLKRTQIYWQRKRLGEAEIAKDHARDRARRARWLGINRERALDTLPPEQYNTRTGDIKWPEALKEPIYATPRRQIEDKLEFQAATGEKSNGHEVHSLARSMQDRLKTEIREMPVHEYLAARRFLDRLVNEVALAQTS